MLKLHSEKNILFYFSKCKSVIKVKKKKTLLKLVIYTKSNCCKQKECVINTVCNCVAHAATPPKPLIKLTA